MPNCPCLFGFVFKIGHKPLKLPATLHSLCRSARTSFFLWIIKLLNFWCSQNECHGCFRCYSTWAFRCWGCYRCRGQFVQTARSLWPLRPKLQSRTFNQGEVLGGIFQWLKDKEPIGRVCQDIDGPTGGFLPVFSNYSPGCLVLHRMTAVSLAFGVAYLDIHLARFAKTNSETFVK